MYYTTIVNVNVIVRQGSWGYVVSDDQRSTALHPCQGLHLQTRVVPGGCLVGRITLLCS